VLAVALPLPLINKISDVRGIAAGTLHDTIGPAKLNHEVVAVLIVREKANCFVESEMRFHKPILAGLDWFVKYIYAKKVGISM
jgi:hypothetical protein